MRGSSASHALAGCVLHQARQQQPEGYWGRCSAFIGRVLQEMMTEGALDTRLAETDDMHERKQKEPQFIQKGARARGRDGQLHGTTTMRARVFADCGGLLPSTHCLTHGTYPKQTRVRAF